MCHTPSTNRNTDLPKLYTIYIFSIPFLPSTFVATASFPIFAIPETAAEAPTASGFGPKAKAYMALGFGILFITWSAIFVKWANVPGPSSAFYRVFIAALVLIPVWAIRRRRDSGTTSQSSKPALTAPSRRLVGFSIIAGVLFAADLALFNTSILMTSAANATLLGNNAPLVVALGGWAVFKLRPSASFWIGLTIATVGTLVIVGGDVIQHPHLGMGDLYAVIASVCYGGYLMVVSRVREQVDTLTLVTITVSASAVALFFITLVLGMPLSGFSATSWASIIGLGLIAQLGGYLAITFALGHLPATLTSICLLIQAPLTALIAVPLLGESISTFQMLGGTLVLGGIYIVNRNATVR